MSISLRAQNMVPNGDFEDYIICPNATSQTIRCNGWRQYTLGSSDYFNVCSIGTDVSVPANFFGAQNPASGNAYAGGYTYYTTSSLFNYKEYVTHTITPLTIGQAYEVSMSVSLAGRSGYGTNDLGVFFYENGPATMIGSNYYIPSGAQISYSSYGPITDTTNWVRLVKVFVADSAYDNIVIGGFKTYNTLTTAIAPGSQNSAYYYFDSIVVRPVNVSVVSVPDTFYCTSESFLLTYNVNIHKTLNPGNIFTAQLSNAAGSFATPVNIGSVTATTSGTISCIIPPNTSPGNGYRMRVVANDLPDTSIDNGADIHILTLSVTAGRDTAICENDSIKIAAVANYAPLSYNWIGPAGFSSGQPSTYRDNSTTAMSGMYIISVATGTCIARDTVNIIVNAYPANHNITVDTTPICAGKTVNITASSTTSSTTYSWTKPDNSTSSSANILIPAANRSDSGMYYITYTNAGCSIKDSAMLQVNPNPTPVTLSTNSPICEPVQLQLNSTATLQGSSYTWKGPNGFTFTGQNVERNPTDTSMSGLYTITLSLNGCTRHDSIPVIIKHSPRDIVLSADVPVCKDDTLLITIDSIEPGAEYQWRGPANFNSANPNIMMLHFSKEKEGLYALTSAIGDCTKSKDINVEFIDPVPYLNSDTLLCENDTLQLNVAINTATYRWQDESTGSSFTIRQPGIYWVAATTKCGLYTDTIKADYHICECIPFVPTAFTPNNDGLNDKLSTIIHCKWTDYKMLIINRFGQEVFKSTNPAITWDGIFKGEPADVGTYFYMLQIKGPRGKDYFYKGDIVLIR
ncbi:MAG: gliding motility-associated C-terminal domain-containing protein [Bacteroidetes bacterium]|nr:gliding motility-associated C-terminal domain-containing protein [Bacteroidota bacterium]